MYAEMYKNIHFYSICFLDYQINYYEVWINWNKVYGVLFDYDIKNYSFIDYPIILGKLFLMLKLLSHI